MKRIIFIMIVIFIFTVNAFSIQLKSKDKFNLKKPVSKVVIKESGEKSGAVLTSPLIIPAKFYGEIVRDESGDYAFYIDRLKYITSWPNGWTHGEHEASGIIIFKKIENGYEAILKENIEIWEMTRGEVRYFDDYYRGDEGLQKVKDRITRVRALVKFIKSQESFPDYFERVWLRANNTPAFNKSIKNFLLNKNTKYPPELIGVYESGTVQRDIEEAIELFFMEYNMSYFFNNILNGSLFEIE